MKRAYSPWIAAMLAMVAGTSLADVTKAARESMPVGRLEAVDLAGLPPECRLFLAIPADSTSELLPWQQRLSVAACRQSIELAPVSDPELFRPMVTRLEQAMEPSVVVYRDAMARGPAQIKILAAYGLGMTNVNLIVRARSAVHVPRDGAAFGGAAYGGRAYLDRSQQLHQALEALLVKQRDAALAAFHELARLAHAAPALARANPVMPIAITDAQRQAALLQ